MNNGSLEFVRALVVEGARTHCANSNSDTPLILASWFGLLGIVDFLLAQHLEPTENLLGDHFAYDHCNLDGNRAVELAVLGGHLSCLRALVDAGASIIPTKSNKYSALHISSHQRDLEITRFLLAHGASVEWTNEKGWTPLHALAVGYEANDRTAGHLSDLYALLVKARKA